MTAAVIAPAIVATVIEAGKTAINESSSPLHNMSRLSKKGQKIGVCSVVKLVKEYRGQKCLFIIIHFLNDRHMRERERERKKLLVVELEEEAKTTTTTTPLLQRQTNPVPYTFTYLRSRDAQRQYPKKLKLLFDYLGFYHPPAMMVMTY
jgi:hypothetical protein